MAIIILWQVGHKIASLMYKSLFRKAVDEPSDTGYVPTVFAYKTSARSTKINDKVRNALKDMTRKGKQPKQTIRNK